MSGVGNGDALRKELDARLVVRSELTRIGDHRIHDRIDMLARAIRMIQSQGVPQFVQKDTLDVAGALPLGIELQVAAVGIENFRAINENIGFLKGGSLCPVIGHRQNSRAEGVAEDGRGKRGGIDPVT